MADSVICPVCGESNPGDMEFCRVCQSRLRPLTGALKGENAPIQPGEPPTRKVTSELEPLLPQWLRDARQQARETSAEDAERAQQDQNEQPAPSAPDLLDGLASQRDEEDEDIPDWLAQITGAKSKKKKPAAEENQVKWVELGHEREQPPAEPPAAAPPSGGAPEGNDLGDWFKQAAASSETADFRMPPAPEPQPSPSAPEQVPPEAKPAGGDLDWLRTLDANGPVAPEPTATTAPLANAEIPDWLKKLEAEQPQEPSQAAELLGRTAPLPPSDVPDWLRQIGQSAPPAPTEPTPPAAPAAQPAQPVVPDWLQGLGSATDQGQPPQGEPPAEAAAFPAEMPDWLSSLPRPEQASPAEPEETASAEPDIPTELPIPDWLSSLPSQQAEPFEPAPTTQEPVVPAEAPDWLSSFPSHQGDVQPPSAPAAPEQPAMPAELPDWLSSLQPQPDEQAALPSEPAPEQAPLPAELPDWLSSMPAQPEAAKPEEPALPAEESTFSMDLPDWLSALPTQSEAALPEQPAAIEAPQAESSETPKPAELPDWLAQLGAAQAPTGEPLQAGQPESQPTISEAMIPEQEPPAAPALTPGALNGEDVDAAFASMQTPDWLSAVLPSVEPDEEEETAPAAQAAEEAIGPAELPSWVQAMRPVESAMDGVSSTEDVLAEQRGPLAGLRGVLPVIAGAAEPSSKPKSYSIKLNASEQQQAHAALLERILAAETAPIPMKVGGLLGSQNFLRWAITALLLLVLGAIVFGRTQLFALPAGVPNETVAAIQAIEAIPADAPVLLVFDYQAATVGEMEAAGGPLLDHLLLLNPPRIAILSTSPTGPALAERFMTRVLSSRGQLQAGQQYVNLGYLPGGLAGIYAFAQNPPAAMPLSAQSSLLAPIHRLSDFSAIVVLTDSLESGRSWIEQTALARGQSTMVLVASAQAGPMLLPYVDSGQVNGMVSGLYGAVGVEQRNAGSPACTGRYGDAAAGGPSCVRRYWDAYSAGLYLALVLIILGALWNLALGLRDRRAQAVG